MRIARFKIFASYASFLFQLREGQTGHCDVRFRCARILHSRGVSHVIRDERSIARSRGRHHFAGKVWNTSIWLQFLSFQMLIFLRLKQWRNPSRRCSQPGQREAVIDGLCPAPPRSQHVRARAREVGSRTGISPPLQLSTACLPQPEVHQPLLIELGSE